ncbi:MAG: hypothetical protein LBS51_03870 [Oscillospiraceae bacterium]|nr:hypothetical protein [Oscillospiraceae bacterium]
MLIICGGILVVFFGISTVAGIIRMISEGDFATYFMETLIPFLPFIAGVIYILVALSGFKAESSLTKKQIVQLIVAVVLAFLGAAVFFMSAWITQPIIILLTGLIAPVIYLVKRLSDSRR